MTDKSQVVGVLMGGLSTERSISLKSGHAVADALRERGWQVREIDVDRDLPARLIAEGVDVAWVALHGRFGEDGCVQGLLEVMGIPYTNSGVRASAVTMDKIATKRALSGQGLRLADDAVVVAGEPMPASIELPVVVKPAVGGSTLGISICRTPAELAAGLADAHALHHEALVEAFVDGGEITVAVLNGVPLPVVRIAPSSGFFDFEAKYTEGSTEYEVPANIDPYTAEAAQQAAVTAYRALGCSGLCRADFMVPDDGEPVFLEINTIPGMTATSLSPMAAGALGISFGELCERLLLDAKCMAAEAPGGSG